MIQQGRKRKKDGAEEVGQKRERGRAKSRARR